MVKDVWNYNALRIGVSNPTLNSTLLVPAHPFVWRDIKQNEVDLCSQLLRVNKAVREVSLVNSNLVAIPRLNDQVECLLIRGNCLAFRRSPLDSGLVDCKLKTLDLATGVSLWGLGHVVEALRGNVHLQCLHFAANDVADAAIPASLFASNPSLLALTLPIIESSLVNAKNILKYVRAFQKESPNEGQTVLVMSKAFVPSWLFEAMQSEVNLQMWNFDDTQVTAAQNQINKELAEYVEALPLSGDLMCVAPASPPSSNDGPITFVSLVFDVLNFAMICLTTETTHLDLHGLSCGVKSLPQLMLYVRNFKTLKLELADSSALECLISLLITLPSARRLHIHVVFSPTTYHGLFSFEDYRLMKAARLWGVKITEDKRKKKANENIDIENTLLAPLACVSIWVSIAGHAVYSKYQCSSNEDEGTPYNLWNVLTFSWIVWMAGLLDLANLDITSHIIILCSYVFCLLVVLAHNIFGLSTEVIPPERRKSLSASVFTLFELSSYLVHLFTVGQLLTLLLFNHHELRRFSSFMMLDVLNPEATLWLWGTVAAIAVATGVIPLMMLLKTLMIFTLPEGFYLFCGIFEIPIMFHLLGDCFRTISDPERKTAHASVVLCILALFMLANSTVWMYLKRAYSGRNALNAGERYMKLDLMIKFLVIFLFYVLADWPQVFRGLAACIFLVEFSIIMKVQPCEQKRGNYFHMGSLAVLVFSTLHTLIFDESLEVVPSGTSLVPVITMGGGIALIILLTFWLIMCVKKNSPSVHMLQAVGRVNVKPLADPKFRFNVDKIQEFLSRGIVVDLVVPPFTANVVREWSMDDVCLPLQIWTVAVVVTAGIGLWGFDPLRNKFYWSEIQSGKYVSVFVFSWFISGCVVLSSNAKCGGEIFAFSVYVMVMVSMSTFCMCFLWLLELIG